MTNFLTNHSTHDHCNEPPHSKQPKNPQSLSFMSSTRRTHPSFTPNIANPTSDNNDLLVDNSPFSRIFHIVVNAHRNACKTPQYDIPGILERGGSVCIPLRSSTKQGLLQVAFLHHFRPVPFSSATSQVEEIVVPDLNAHGCVMLELPRGITDDQDEGIATATAIRETREEIGTSLNVLRAMHVGTVNANTALFMNDVHVCAIVVEHDELSCQDEATGGGDETEMISKVEWIDVQQVSNVIAQGKIRCGLTLAALALFMARQTEFERFVHTP